jgi:hypothetical protein
MNAADFVTAVLNDEMNADYDVMFDAMTEDSDTQDPFVTLAYHFSEQCDTTEKFKKAKVFMHALIDQVLSLNMSESQNCNVEQE